LIYPVLTVNALCFSPEGGIMPCSWRDELRGDGGGRVVGIGETGVVGNSGVGGEMAKGAAKGAFLLPTAKAGARGEGQRRRLDAMPQGGVRGDAAFVFVVVCVSVRVCCARGRTKEKKEEEVSFGRGWAAAGGGV